MPPGLKISHRGHSLFHSSMGDDVEMANQAGKSFDLQDMKHPSGPLLPAPVSSSVKSNRRTVQYSDGSPSSSSTSTPMSCQSHTANVDTFIAPVSPSSTLYDTSSITIEQKRDLIISLGQALYNFGSPSYRVEDGLKLTAAKLDLSIIFTFTPETLLMTAVQKTSTISSNTKILAKTLQRNHRNQPSTRSSYNKRKDKSRYKDMAVIVTKKIGRRTKQKRKTAMKSDLKSNQHTNRGKTRHQTTVPISSDSGTSKEVERQPWIILMKTRLGPDNAKLGQISRLMHRFYTDDLAFDSCLYQLKYDIIAAPATCGPWTLITAFVCIAFSASIIMFRGTWIDSGFAAFFGLLSGSLLVLASHRPMYAHVYEVSACATVSLIVRYLHPYCCFNATVIPSIIVLLPGYSMTMAVMEITAKHIVTGTIRLIHVIFYSFLLAYGMALGSYLYDAFHPNMTSSTGYCPGTANEPDPLLPPEWVNILLFPVMAAGISMTFGSAPHQWISEILCAALGYCVTYFLGPYISDTSILNAISAFVVGLYAHLALKVTGEPPLSPISVGLTLLVPGVRGAYALLHQKDVVKSDFALQMLNIAIGLSVGLFASGMVVYPSGKRRSLYISL